jgi:hypothetical protein
MLASSPGIESSVTAGSVSASLSCQCERIASRTAGGRAPNSGTDERTLAYSGKAMRRQVR